jgi:hypothetical protein
MKGGARMSHRKNGTPCVLLYLDQQHKNSESMKRTLKGIEFFLRTKSCRVKLFTSPNELVQGMITNHAQAIVCSEIDETISKIMHDNDQIVFLLALCEDPGDSYPDTKAAAQGRGFNHIVVNPGHETLDVIESHLPYKVAAQ